MSLLRSAGEFSTRFSFVNVFGFGRGLQFLPNAAPRALTREEVAAELMGRRAAFEAQRRAMRGG